VKFAFSVYRLSTVLDLEEITAYTKDQLRPLPEAIVVMADTAKKYKNYKKDCRAIR
jgi:hypothetical protein